MRYQQTLTLQVGAMREHATGATGDRDPDQRDRFLVKEKLLAAPLRRLSRMLFCRLLA